MDWFTDLLWGTGVAHSVILLSLVIVFGILLGKVRIAGISLGITFVLFVGIVMGHFGLTIDPLVLHFFKEFGLILFVYSIGMQVGPGFFSSFKRGGITLNLLATTIVLLGATLALVIHYITGTPVETMVGILSGAVTNTPGLGAAQEAFGDVHGQAAPTIALGYAVAYPLGVVGIILAIISLRFLFRIDYDTETAHLEAEDDTHDREAHPMLLVVKNPALFGRTVGELSALMTHCEFVISRIRYCRDGRTEIVSGLTTLHEGDRVLVITTEHDAPTVRTFVGEEAPLKQEEWLRRESELLNRRILVTKPEVNGKRLGELRLRQSCGGINITRINRAGIDLVATPRLSLQVGDRVNVVGTPAAIEAVEKVLGNSMKRLNEPNLIPLFLGIALGVFLGSIPLLLPGIPRPVKLGLAGGPLIVAILFSRFGPRYGLVTYTTASANLMLREVGITIFLASVGISAGDGFVDTLLRGGGASWVAYGFLITFLPLMAVGLIARRFFRLNYFTLMGLLSGSTTDPPALAYSNATAGNDAPAVGYATVYPLTMFLRVLTAQLMILLFT
ncbi:transporter [Tannerella sp. oral taxon 808]|nr:transporter [Tannerella sp. oral taxon 808]